MGPQVRYLFWYFSESASAVANASTVQSGAQAGQPLLVTGSADDGVVESFKIQTTLQTGTTYFWRIVSKTMANQTANGPTWSFTTQGSSPSPTPSPSPSPVLLKDSSTNRGLVLHSPLKTREPFTLTTIANLSTDKRTRVMLFVTNVDLSASSAVS